MSNDTNRQASVDSRRIALEREISIRVPRFDTFVTEYSSNISTTGMYIVSDNPQPPGTTFSFEFSVADDWKLIRGKAQVVWTRYRDEGPERPPGMGVRFLELDAQSRRLIRWIVEKHIREGGKPFELDELRSVIDQALEQVLDTDELPQQALQAPARDRRSPNRPTVSVRNAASVTARKRAEERRALPLLLTAAAVLVIVGLLFWLTEWLPARNAGRSIARVEADSVTEIEPTDDTGDPAALVEPTPAEMEGTPAAAPESTSRQPATSASNQSPSQQAAGLGADPPPVGSAYKSVLDSVTAWAGAWSDQNVDAYLSHYAESFRPTGPASRRQWEAQRRERLLAPDFIKVSISGLEFQRLDDRRVRVLFTQSYRSNSFSDMVEKTMDLVWERGRWRIAHEAAR